MIDEILKYYPEEEFLMADGFSEAIIGVEENEMRLIYSVSKCLKILMFPPNDSEGMSEEEANEFFTFNVSGAYVGEKTPIWCWDNFD